MDAIYLIIVAFILILAIFDLVVGVSNDAVNFLNSAIGAKVAKFKTIIAIAAIGILIGALTSNGMMDIARHGMFHPQHYYFTEIMCIFLAVMVTDVFLLDMFNSLGMPTSTTVSMVFELLGGAFAMAVIKYLSTDGAVGFGEMLNTEKALSVIAGIFLSVAIAFVFGTIVMWIARIVFTFNFKKHLRYTIGIFGGIAITSIVYFMLVKGLKTSSIMTPELRAWIDSNTWQLLLYMFLGFSVIMQLLHWCKVNVLRIVVLSGTFALAMAFAGNDLVNFIGVPLAGLDSYQYYMSEGSGVPSEYLMGRLNDPATSPFIYLALAGVIMVIALLTSKKAHNVVKTSLDLSKQGDGDEIFASSKIARTLVRNTMATANTISKLIPERVKSWVNNRFDNSKTDIPEGAAFDTVRAAVNLVLAGLLIAAGTSLKLPLSTTYVTFMVAMGSSLADRAWGRESAVFRITGVISVIGGWFITAGAAFILAFLVTNLMHFGGFIVMGLLIILTIYLLIRSNIRYKKREAMANSEDPIFQEMVKSKDSEQIWPLLQQHFAHNSQQEVNFIINTYTSITDSFINEELKGLRKAKTDLDNELLNTKRTRKREMICLKMVESKVAFKNNTWLHLGFNSCEQMIYCLKRINEPCKEHVDNNFTPLPDKYIKDFLPIRDKVVAYFMRGNQMIITKDYPNTITALLEDCEHLKDELSRLRKLLIDNMQHQTGSTRVYMVYLNMLQESQELVSAYRHLMRSVSNFEGYPTTALTKEDARDMAMA